GRHRRGRPRSAPRRPVPRIREPLPAPHLDRSGLLMSDATLPETDGSGASEPSAVAEAEAPRRRRARTGPPLWVRGVTALVFLAVAGLIFFLSQTGDGQRLVLNQILERVRGALAGELSVGDIR